MKRYLILFGAMLLATSGMSDTWTDPKTGIEWTYTISGGEVNAGTPGDLLVRVDAAPDAVVKEVASENGPVSGPVNGPVNCERAQRLYDAIARYPGLRKVRLCEMTGISDRTLKRYLANELAETVEFRGAPKTGGYYVKEHGGGKK